ncbi:conserved hypothetical protein [Methylorubrum populi BJ001]|jgi:hypothetical protein|uniref:Uncharacterized protein n=1 Tax=Methylorubrum populi (strain ATCC BAA-705 / NCIMB 13946 / BJ001) TaxID=441620 RepID=B1Z7X2_METPB|nr:hypothetical protein [Methylorubrum populi]ACB78943.1 conserved hypothetical protein [Methylorubrum populi BJ001]OAH32352.1 hypothetical protein AX289_07900 [Methylorubrum populi]PZP71360.1 MAG: hypothetical protein DI590_06575 [Methylorubrum populi]
MRAGLVTAPPDAAERHAQGTLERALTLAFWQALQREPMHVMAALEAAARTVGALYRQVAAAHGPDGHCTCGWEPDPEADLIVLEAMLAAALSHPARHDLADMVPAGRA